MIDKLSNAMPFQNCSSYECFRVVFTNPKDVTDFYRGCRDWANLTSFIKELDNEYEVLKMLNGRLKATEEPFDFISLRSKEGGLSVLCKLKPEFVPKKSLQTITPLLGYVYMENLKWLYPQANEETLKALKEFIWDNTNCADGAEKATELIKSWNRQLNDGDDFIVLRAKDCHNPFVSHKLCINKKDLY